jgi:hypothetical protein
VETWENLQARLLHLGWLAEELPAFVARPSGAWLFRQIVRECQTVAAIAAEYIAECERAGLTGPNGTTPPPGPCWCGNPHPSQDGDHDDSRPQRAAGADRCPQTGGGDAL